MSACYCGKLCIAPHEDTMSDEAIDRIERNLKRCPFCLGKAFINAGVESCVECDNCGARGPECKEILEATAAWDTRIQAAPFIFRDSRSDYKSLDSRE